MLDRSTLRERVRVALRRSRVVALLGPRQCGKTTLAQELIDVHSLNYFDLEDSASLQRLHEPMTALQNLRGVVVIDEVQRRPELFPILRVLADRVPLPARFLILGSASPALLRQSSESLAGRLERVMMGGFSLNEVGVECKRVDAPGMTPSMRIALDDLKLERIAVVYPGTLRYPIADRVEAVPLSAIVDGMKGLFPSQ